jgi:hypothetical protein
MSGNNESGAVPVPTYLGSRIGFLETQIRFHRREASRCERELASLVVLFSEWEAKHPAGEETSSSAHENMTIIEMVRALLEERPVGFTPQELVRAAKDRFGRVISNKSLPAQLGRMRDAGLIVKRSRSWHSTMFGPKR